MIGEDGDGFQLQINLQPGMEAANILSNLTTRIGRAGYLFDEDDEGYHSANNQIVIYINNIDNKMLEIQVRFIEEEEPPVEEEENVTYTFICDNTNFDITSDDARIFLYVWDAEGNVDWIELYYEESGQNQKEFEVEISNKWIGCQVVRFAPDSEIAWKPSDEESTVTIWNRTSEREDVSLDGKGGEVHFTLY